MAERRMFAKTIIDSDAFLDMPLSTQALYFHLSMRADDDGFINNPRKVQRIAGCADDDLKLLIVKNFLLPFESGVVVIKHWRVHNYIRGDRYKPTVYEDEKAQLCLKENGAYTLGIPDGIPDDNQMETQVRLGKVRLGKVKETGSSSFLCSPSLYAGDPVDDYLRDQRKEPSPEALKEGARLTAKIFPRWCGRGYTREDEHRVALCVEQYGSELVMYAFEQAFQNGRPGNWNYINGILRNLKQRGVDTLEDAEGLDWERRG